MAEVGGKIIACEPFVRWWDAETSSNKLIQLFEDRSWDLFHTVGTELNEDGYHAIFFYAIFTKDAMKF